MRAPYFGQIFLAGVLGIVGYPDSLLNPSDNTGSGDGSDNVLHSGTNALPCSKSLDGNTCSS